MRTLIKKMKLIEKNYDDHEQDDGMFLRTIMVMKLTMRVPREVIRFIRRSIKVIREKMRVTRRTMSVMRMAIK